MVGNPEREERFLRLVDADAYDAVWRYACRLSQRREDAEDLLQDALAQAYQRLEQLRDETVVKGWLFAIARNLHLSRLRRQRVRQASPRLTPCARLQYPQVEASHERVALSLSDYPGLRRAAGDGTERACWLRR